MNYEHGLLIFFAFAVLCTAVGATVDSCSMRERYKTCIQAGHAPKDCP